MNHRAQFDAASFILGGEILNHTKLHTHTQNYNLQTVTHISTSCLSACADNKLNLNQQSATRTAYVS